MISELIGSCSSLDPEAWFPEIGKGVNNGKYIDYIAKVDYAKSICQTCPIKRECLAEGLKEENLTNGIWGGTTPAERCAMVGYLPTTFGSRAAVSRVFEAEAFISKFKERLNAGLRV